MKRILTFSSLVLFATLFVTACGASSPGSPATPTLIPSTPIPTQAVSQSPMAAAPPTSGALLGVYENGNAPNGPETLTLLDGGRYILQIEGNDNPITGTLAISAGQMVFTEAAGGGDCPGEPGTYKFVTDGKALTFTKVQDPYCDLRVEDFTSGPWSRKP